MNELSHLTEVVRRYERSLHVLAQTFIALLGDDGVPSWAQREFMESLGPDWRHPCRARSIPASTAVGPTPPPSQDDPSTALAHTLARVSPDMFDTD